MTQTARVYVNNIEIGAIPVDQYEQIRNEIKADRSLLMRQIVNCAWSTCCGVAWSFMMVPFLWIGVLFVMLLFTPDELATTLQDLASTPARDIISGLRLSIFPSLIVCCMGWAIATALTGGKFATRLGYVDHRKRALDYRLKRLLESPADGPLGVIVWADGWPRSVLTSAE